MMDNILVAGYTVHDTLLAVCIIAGLLIALSLLKMILRKEKVNHHVQFAACEGCGWQGRISRHAGHCPGCNQPLGNRMTGRRPRQERHIAEQRAE